MNGRPSIGLLLLGANALVLLVPISAIAGLRLYDVALLRQTERQLIAESVLIGEAFRDAYVRAGGPASEEHVPPQQARDRYLPTEPVIDVGTPMLAATLQAHKGNAQDTIAVHAGAAIEPMMRRAQTFNLSGVRVLAGDGCVVATTRSQGGECLDVMPEVKRALSGSYAAVLRERISDEPAPAYGDVRRRGGVRVFTALPVWHGARVIGVVTASRTGLDARSSLWQNRREIVMIALMAIFLMVMAALLFAWAIARPLRQLTASAREIVEGKAVPNLAVKGFLPSEIAVLSDALLEMTQRLQARADEAAERTAHVSHELKTPLSAIRGAVELLRDHDSEMSAAQRERFIANIDADAERMERLVTRLLTLARIESDAGKAAEPIDVEQSVRGLLARYDDVQITVATEWHAIAALAIRQEHLASVVLNLVDNARRHGAGKPVIVRLARAQERVEISVSDQGDGISEANQSRVFDRFFTTERDRGGTGLGLAIVKAVAEARGGHVRFETSPQGTVFTVTL